MMFKKCLKFHWCTLKCFNFIKTVCELFTTLRISLSLSIKDDINIKNNSIIIWKYLLYNLYILKIVTSHNDFPLMWFKLESKYWILIHGGVREHVYMYYFVNIWIHDTDEIAKKKLTHFSTFQVNFNAPYS